VLFQLNETLRREGRAEFRWLAPVAPGIVPSDGSLPPLPAAKRFVGNRKRPIRSSSLEAVLELEKGGRLSHQGNFADGLVLSLLATHLDGALPREPGRSMLDRIDAVLRPEGLTDQEHRRQVFARTLTRARRLLGHGVKPVDPEGWLRSLVDQTLADYLCERVEPGSSWIVALLEGNEAMGGDPLAHEQRTLEVVYLAIAALPAPYRRFLEYDIVKRVSLDEIQDALGFSSREEVIRFKKQAFEALRSQILAQEKSSHWPPLEDGNNAV